MLTTPEIASLLAVAILGHAMALFWYIADKMRWNLCSWKIYDLPISDEQIKRELRNSIHAPMHAVILAVFLLLGFFKNTTWPSFVYTALLTTLWAEVWHYLSHRAFHLRALHWIHIEHHKSHLNSPITAISFSFSEKLIFDFGILIPLAALDEVATLNAFGIIIWYVGYLVINSFSHANFEFKPANFNRWLGQVLTSTTYHSLHHSRYTGNYGLGTRVLDRLLGTEWADYEPLYDQICRERRPLKKLRERAHELTV